MKGIDTFTLKMIGLVTMLLDHIGMIFFPNIILFRVIGRLAFPIFAYVLVEGFCYTKDIYRYMLRLLIFALISEVPFDLATKGTVFSLESQNVMFTLLLGILMLYFYLKTRSLFGKCVLLIIFLLIAEFCRVDYSSMGLAMIFIFYQLRDEKLQKTIGITIINLILMGGVQAFGALAMVPISLHNRKQGIRAKWLFGFFYPTHLLALYLLSRMI